ncbi:ABC transporter ATP-binding protein [Propioniciclava soli]|uniref:ABC transporter ATP-binding protein n=1 Tax=Propioniciclava soli TaxID=2775081 RepID=A0ABZ3CBC8_9ACTN
MQGAARADAPLQLDGVGRRFGDHWAVRDASLTITPGESVALLGPNGAGKSTLVALACGLRRPTQGDVRLFGRDPRRASARRWLGVVPQANALPEMLRVGEVVELVARHHRDPVPTAELLDGIDLAGARRTFCGALSGGQRRRVMVALALVGRPRLLVLDEPTTGMDAESREALWQRLADHHAAGGAMLLTSHHVEEAERLCRTAIVLRRGTVAERGPIAALKQRYGTATVTLDTPVRPERLGDLAAVRHAGALGPGRVELVTSDADETVRALVGAGVEFAHLQINRASLTDVVATLGSEES